MMIELKVVKEELKKVSHNFHGQNLTARLEVSRPKEAFDTGSCFVLQRTQGSEKVMNQKSEWSMASSTFFLWVEMLRLNFPKKAKVLRKKAGLSTDP